MADASSNVTWAGSSRRAEVRALLRWWVTSWLRPAGESLRWEQDAGRDTGSGTGSSHEKSPRHSEGIARSNRHQNIKQTGTGS